MLEVGAGMGATTRALCDRRHASWVCLEPDAALGRKFDDDQRREAYSTHVSLRRGTLDALQPGEQFDTVLYIDVLEHIEDDRAELAAAARVLRPGGRVIVLAPAHNWLFSPFDRAIGHFRRYDRARLRATAPETLRLIHAEYLDSAGMVLSLGNRLISRQKMPTPSQIRFWDRVVVPCSRLTDVLTLRRVGKSILMVWRSDRMDDHPRTSES